MENLQVLYSNWIILVVLAVLILLVIILIILNSNKKKKVMKEFENVNVRYNNLKTKPINFNFNKASAIAKVNPSEYSNMAQIESEYSDCQNILRNVGKLIEEVDDNLAAKHIKQCSEDIKEINALCDEGEEKFAKLQGELDKILEQESKQRSEIIELKEKFRNLKQLANEKSSQLSFAWETVERNISNTEKMFSSFEEYTYAAEYEKANMKVAEIKTSMDNLSTIVNSLPQLLQLATGTIPQYIEAVDKAYVKASANDINLAPLEVESKLNTIKDGLRDDLISLKNGQGVDVENHLTDYKKQLVTLAKEIKSEEDSNKEMLSLYEETTTLNKNCNDLISEAKNQLDNATVKFDIENADKIINLAGENMEQIGAALTAIDTVMASKEMSASVTVDKLKLVKEKIENTYSDVKDLKSQLDTAKSDEDRAKKQLLKLQVVVNEIQVKIRERKLISISNKYEQDVSKAFEYIYAIERALNEENLDLTKVNATISEANDFIYRLYNDVNNIVGTAVMVENAIVFGNRYRSTYSDIDSDLTRAELSFRNGEYTNALRIAIDTIEKLHPNSFESLVKGNSNA